MERKNVFAGVVLLTALLSTSSVFAAEQPSWWSKLRATTSTASQAVGSIIKQNRVAVATATATGVVTAGLLYWSWLASNIADNDGYADATRAEMKNWSRLFAAVGTTAALTTAKLLKDAYDRMYAPRVTYVVPADNNSDELDHPSLLSPEAQERGDRLRAVVAARAVRGEAPLVVTTALHDAVMANAIGFDGRHDGRGNPVLRTRTPINGNYLFARNDDTTANDVYPVTTADIVDAD